MRKNKLLQKAISYFQKGIMQANPKTIFQVISETEKYQRFIPWCNSSKIIYRNSPYHNKTQLAISFKNINKISYVSQVNIQPFQNQILGKAFVHSVCNTKPLKALDSMWIIQKCSKNRNYSSVQYSLNFQFDSLVLQLASGVVNKYLGQQMWKIFQKQSLKRQKDKLVTPISTSLQNSQINQQLPQKVQKSVQIETNLFQFLQKNPHILQIYRQNKLFRDKVNNFHQSINGSKQYNTKMRFQLQNALTYFSK